MKKLLVTAVLVLLPLTVCAQMPYAESFQTLADRMGIQRDEQEQIVQFAKGLKGDTVVDCAIASLYPPAIDITFASGREIHAHGTELQLVEGTDRTIVADEVCPVTLVTGAVLAWTGFIMLSLPLLTAGIEVLLLTAIICL
ncbi:MAG: hypothetical protein WCQ99_15035 [Pseudomonadota bacterium]